MKKFWNFIVLALVGGAIGLQEFYLEKWVLGVLAVVFCWTGIPAIVAAVEAFVWLFRGEDEFNTKYSYFIEKQNVKKNLQLLND